MSWIRCFKTLWREDTDLLIISSKYSNNLCVWGSKINIRCMWCPHWMKHRPDSVLKITAWDQKHLQKSLSVNTIHFIIHKCCLKLYHAKKKPNENRSRNALLSDFKWTETKLFCDQTNQSLETKEERDHLYCYQCSHQKSSSLLVWRRIRV